MLSRMTDREFFLARRKVELPAFLNVLRALPADQLDYKPHENSPSARQLVWTIAQELKSAVQACDTGEASFPTDPAPDLPQMIAAFEKNYADIVDRAGRMDDAGWARKAAFKSGGKVVREMPVGEFAWMLFFDAIHHRGQLAAYLRPMGGKVPSIYGPSADTRPA
jgi:uncharacterized damage-inducible protein DinB